MGLELLKDLANTLEGELLTDESSRVIYATDASAYREKPVGVAFPKSEQDVQRVLQFCSENNLPVIPRAAGTSLAGQVVGHGLVVDISRYLTRILHIDTDRRQVTVQPGVIRDELNHALRPHGLFFGPETSTSNRCMIGGMMGNNSCGARSLVYGSVRDHIISVKGFLADGTPASFGPVSNEEYRAILDGEQGAALQRIYGNIDNILSDAQHRSHISHAFPKPSIPRRNTGYALDLLADSEPFGGTEPINLASLICGSEGTLFFATEITLGLVDAPLPHVGLVCAHFNTIHESLLGNLEALKCKPTAVEMMDHYILECTKENLEQKKNRFFVVGDPAVILAIEFTASDEEELTQKFHKLELALTGAGVGYAYPRITGEDVAKVWSLRKAGLGLLSNIPGDAKPAPVIEDTAVDVTDLPDFIAEFNSILRKRGLSCVHYAHAATGELHLRPILNLKADEDRRMFRQIATDIAHLVKKYRGSLSGEHGDGRLRGEFIELMYGPEITQWFRSVKQVWDPQGILNPGKITDTPAMDTMLRYEKDQKTPEIDTFYRFDHTLGYVRAAEMCNGSGDCRKSEISGGVMCPSYMATRMEQDTTRARANMLRELITRSEKPEDVFGHPDADRVLDLCLSCKGCKSECPSNVDMARLKSEYQYQKHRRYGTPRTVKLFASSTKAYARLASVPWLYNLTVASPVGALIKALGGVHQKRKMPRMSAQPLSQWFGRYKAQQKSGIPLVLISDEFTEWLDADVGQSVVRVLNRLGFEVRELLYLETGRIYMSKGLLEEARRCCDRNLNTLAPHLNSDIPILGIEPSAALSFRDEYPDLCTEELKDLANAAAQKVRLVDEFLSEQAEQGIISAENFTSQPQDILIHGHCHQKVLSGMGAVRQLLNLPEHYNARLIPSGCCGMAGSFGYEKNHFAVSQKVGNLVLFPAVSQAGKNTLIAANGFSCRHQIADGTGKKAIHPIQILEKALI